jgi:hypothetical protein
MLTKNKNLELNKLSAVDIKQVYNKNSMLANSFKISSLGEGANSISSPFVKADTDSFEDRLSGNFGDLQTNSDETKSSGVMLMG